jgi:hypothetical protein
VLQRQTQTATFWRDQFDITNDDIEFLYNLLQDTQGPLTLVQLTTALIEEYLRQEEAKIRSELAKGAVYMPKETFAIGQKVVFPALDFTVGEVTGIRDGQNPEFGDFKVIKVQFEDGQREFAANLARHRLNQGNGNNVLDQDALLSAVEIYSLYQDEINDSVLFALEEGDRHQDFVEVDGAWLLADMLAEIHIGYLNIAEAMIEVQAKPMKTSQLLTEVDLESLSNPVMRTISLDHALSNDQRFDRVTSNGESLWFLRRLEPKPVLSVPPLLRYTSIPYNRALLSVELLQIEWELDDEWGESGLTSEIPRIVPTITITLTYPHWRYGTLPLNGRTVNFFPGSQKGKSMITLVDGRWGTRYTGWVIHEERYVYGLAKWFEDHALPVGAYITLERTNNANEVIVDYRTRRAKREWARVAAADLDHKALRFEMNKVQVACEYDEYLIVAEQEREPIDQLRTLLQSDDISFSSIVEEIVLELIKLNPQGTVHAKSIYSAVNMIRRCPPGPIFYALISNRKFRDVGNGFFALA